MQKAVLVLFIFSSTLLGWAKNGHRISAHIAQQHLTGQARQAIEAFMGRESLAEGSNWPDEMRSNPDWGCAGPMHYVSIEEGESYKTSEKSKRGDIIRALVYFEKVLRDKNASKKKKQVALRFYVHLLSDLHQPLHVGLACDRGGNSVTVRYFGKNTRLHTVWDEHLVEGQRLSYTEFSAELDKSTESERSLIARGNYVTWAEESLKLRRKAYQCYKEDRCIHHDFFDEACQRNQLKKMDIKLKYQYDYQVLPIVRQQLLLSGIRLAAKLNQIFSGQVDSEEAAVYRQVEKSMPGEQARQCVESVLNKN